MFKLSLNQSLALILLFPVCSAAAEDLHTRNSPSETLVKQTSKADSKKAIGFDESELNRINGELEILDLQKKPDWREYWNHLQQRQQLLDSFIIEKQPTGKSQTELYATLGKPLNVWESSRFELERTELFSISDGMKAKPNPIKTSMVLEVTFRDGVSVSYRYLINKAKTGTNIKDLSTQLDEFPSLPKNFLYGFGNGREEYLRAFWHMKIEDLLQAAIQAEAEAENISASSIGQTCYVAFRVSRDGSVTAIQITRSSNNDRFDNLVVRTLNRLSGKKFLQFGQAFREAPVVFNSNFALSNKNSANTTGADNSFYDAF